MKNILITWELGGNFGHYGNVSTLAKYFNKHGYTIILALKEINNIHLFNLPENIKVIKIPENKIIIKNYPEIYTYSEILFINGFSNSNNLKVLVQEWCKIIDEYKIDIIINDYGPVSVIAGKIKKILTISVNSGFFIPPVTDKVTVFKTWVVANKNQYMKTELIVLRNINSLFKNIKFDSVSKAICSDLNFISSYPELDHYKDTRPFSENNYFIGNLQNDNLGKVYSWPDIPGKKILAYLNIKYQNLNKVIFSLIETKLPVLLYIKDLDIKNKEIIKNTNIKLANTLIDFNSAFIDCDIFICNGGVNSITQSLNNGKPLILIPTTSEQYIISKIISDLKLGIILLNENINIFKDIINDLLYNDDYTKNAMSFKNKYYYQNSNYGLDIIRNTISNYNV